MSQKSTDLTSWVQNHLSAIYEAQSDDDLHKAFESTFSPSCEIFSNHEGLQRELLRDDMIKRRTAASNGSKVHWENLISIPKNDENPDEAGIVAGSLRVTRSLKFRIRAAPAQTLNMLVISAKIEQGTEADAEGDHRRIVHIWMTSQDKRPPIHFPGQPLKGQQSNDGDNDNP